MDYVFLDYDNSQWTNWSCNNDCLFTILKLHAPLVRRGFEGCGLRFRYLQVRFGLPGSLWCIPSLPVWPCPCLVCVLGWFRLRVLDFTCFPGFSTTLLSLHRLLYPLVAPGLFLGSCLSVWAPTPYWSAPLGVRLPALGLLPAVLRLPWTELRPYPLPLLALRPLWQ